ncbi:MAG: hypothetical protein ACR2KL_02840 [Nocardioidaceae bacterium]
MGLLGRLSRRRGSGTLTSDRGSQSLDRQHLDEFVATRQGVEGFVEPRTTVTETTLLLVGLDGEWTRRRVPSAAWAHDFCNRLGVPSYDAAVVGYPQRMRDFNRRQTRGGTSSAG